MTMLRALENAVHGDTLWMDTVRARFFPSCSSDQCSSLWFQHHYFKAYAYRVEPLVPKGYVSIDGESFPYLPYELEVHQGLGRVLSMHGRYNVEFDAPAGL